MFVSSEREEKLAHRKMADLRRKHYLPAELLDLVEQVMALQRQARHDMGEPSRLLASIPDGDLASVDRVVQGAALLARERFPFDSGKALALFGRLLDVLAGLGGPQAQAADVIRQEGESLALRSFEAFLHNDQAFFADLSARTPQAPGTLAFLAQSSLTPGIMAVAEAVSKVLPGERTWDHATCPVCGSLPFHSSFQSKEGVRVHACSFCRAEYRTFRLQCPYCQERDAAKLPFFTADEEPGYRVDTCQTCKGYIKTTDFREFDRPSLPALDDLESMALDILAVKRGYLRSTASAWGF